MATIAGFAQLTYETCVSTLACILPAFTLLLLILGLSLRHSSCFPRANHRPWLLSASQSEAMLTEIPPIRAQYGKNLTNQFLF